MNGKRLVSLVLLMIGCVLCLLLLPIEIWLAIIGIVLIILAFVIRKSC